MGNIVIATQNLDKFLLVTHLLKDLGLSKWNFKNLWDFKIYDQVEETGTAEDRAIQKAVAFAESQPDTNNIDVVLGYSGESKPVSQTDESKVRDLNVKFSKANLKPVIDKLITNS